MENDQKTKETSAMSEVFSSQNLKVAKPGESTEGVVLSVSKNEIHLDLGFMGTGVVRGEDLQSYLQYQDAPKVGEKVEAYLERYENENGEVELTFTPPSKGRVWRELQEMVDQGEILNVKILDANKGGLMVKLKGIPAFLPVSQLLPEHYPRVEGGDKTLILEELKKFVGERVRVKVINADREEDKLIISERAVKSEEHKKAVGKLKIGERVDGVVSGVVNFGLFVKFNEGLEGLVHISELDWQRVDDPHDLYNVGDKVRAEIIGIEDAKVSLSIKKLKNDPWVKAAKKYLKGQIIEGEITKMTPFGAFVQIDPQIHGLAHISELKTKTEEAPRVNVGDKAKFKILSVEPDEHRLGLTLNIEGSDEEQDKKEDAEKAAVEEPKKEDAKKDEPKKATKTAKKDKKEEKE